MDVSDESWVVTLTTVEKLTKLLSVSRIWSVMDLIFLPGILPIRGTFQCTLYSKGHLQDVQVKFLSDLYFTSNLIML